jgi:hypothetical protein
MRISVMMSVLASSAPPSSLALDVHGLAPLVPQLEFLVDDTIDYGDNRATFSASLRSSRDGIPGASKTCAQPKCGFS